MSEDAAPTDLADRGAFEVLRSALDTGPLEIAALGRSMRPTLRPGDRVRLHRRRPRRGDVALALVGQRLVLHRLLRHRGGRWLMRGDARPRPDGWVTDADILAVATARRREGSESWQALDQPRARLGGLAVAPVFRAATTVMGRLRGALRSGSLLPPA